MNDPLRQTGAVLNGSSNILSTLLFLLTAGLGLGAWFRFENWIQVAVIGVVGFTLSASPRLVNEWERGVLLRLGKFRAVLKPGIIWIFPGIDLIVTKVDMRVRSTSFSAEKTLTKDTVPVDVDAVLFWVVTDAKKAILEVEQFEITISWAAQTTLRDIIGKAELCRMISDRETMDAELLKLIDEKTSEWGVTVQSVEIRDVRIPTGLEDAMSRKAQADREREARVILAESEVQVAEKMKAAAGIYQSNTASMQLRAMNMTYESIKEKGALMIVPSSLSDSMTSGVMGLAAAGFRHQSDASS